MAVNLVVQDGVVHNLALRYSEDGKPELRFTLQQVENGFTLYLPCCALGSAAEKVAAQINDGDHVVITSGRLTYRKRSTKLGEQSRMEILVWAIDVITPAGVPQEARSADGEGGDSSTELNDAPEPMPAPKPRRRSYPTAALSGGFDRR
jgi:single-stranded DNA-binding protein